MLPQQRNNEDEKSAVRSLAEHQAKKQGRKAAKKLVKKGMKIGKQLAKAGAKKLVLALGKLIAWFVGAIGLPAILIGFAAIIAIVVISLAFSFMMGTGEGLEGEEKALHEYIVQQANKTVNMSSAIERPYRVPEELIAATIQLEVMQKNDDMREIIKNMATKLKPIFDYGKYDEWTENQTIVYEDGVKVSDTGVKRTSNIVTKLDHVDYWNGSKSYIYTPKVSDWKESVQISYRTETYTEIVDKDSSNSTGSTGSNGYSGNGPRPIGLDGNSNSSNSSSSSTNQESTGELVEKTRRVQIKTVTKTRHQYFESTSQTTSDYTTFDNILNSYGLNINDKRLLEANYIFMDGDIAYTDWLEMSTGGYDGFFGGGYFFDGNIIPGAGVPPQFMPIYRAAEKKYGVDWYVLAAIHATETKFSTHQPMISSAGAIGHMQFMPATWVGWSYNIGSGLVSSSVDITSIPVISKGGGYGRDGNGDGKADPWDLEDAVHTAAYYLARNGYANDPRNAIWHYNHADWYVDKVLKDAALFKDSATYEGGDKIQQLLTVGNRWIGKSVYIFGGGRNQSDISRGRFDCSAFVHWAFAQIGVDLGPLGSVSTETLNKIGKKVSPSEMKPGDILFWDTYKRDGHVGIYLGNGKWIGSQGSTGVAIVDMNSSYYTGYYKPRFSGHVRRIIQ